MEDAIANVKGQLLGQMAELGVKSTTTKKGRKVTVVEPVRSSWKEDVLKDILGPLWPEVIVVKEVLVESKLEAVCDREAIDIESLADAVVETQTKPYLKITKPRGKLK